MSRRHHRLSATVMCRKEPIAPVGSVTERRARSVRPGFATFLVLWVLAAGTLALLAVQASAFSQAALGREALARTRAYWAARAGVEALIARLEDHTENPATDDAYALRDDLAQVSTGTLEGAEYLITHATPNGERLGPLDAHSRINIHQMNADALMLLPYMTEDVADAILDWVDEDDDVRELGAEIGQYTSTPYPYNPRNAPFRSLLELELVLGVLPEFVRGEDWNLNGLLDMNERDGNASWPPDNADDVLDAEWSAIITVASRDGGFAASGEERLDLAAADASELVRRVGVDARQADVIVNYVSQTPTATMGDFIRTNLNNLRNAAGERIDAQAPALEREQLAALLNECELGVAAGPRPGKVNINTCDAEILEYVPQIDASLADAITAERDARTNGFTSVADLLDVPGMTRGRLAQIFNLFDVRSNVYVAVSRGRDSRTGIECHITATLDRTTLPLTIREVHVR